MAENSASDGGGGGAKFFPTAWHVARRLCDSCDSAAALLFCRKDAAFLCMACDVKLHRHTRHERVWMCEVCEQAPACVTCKADAAALCVTCDRDIHSANPLARRHERIPVVPFYDSAEALVRSTAGDLLDPESGFRNNELNSSVSREDDDHEGWGVPTTTNANVKFPSATSHTDMKSIDLFAAADRLFDFGFPMSKQVKLQSQLRDSVNDGVVPVQTTVPATNFPQVQRVDHHQSPETPYEIDFTRSTTNSNNKSNSQSQNHNVSCSSMDAGVVPEQKSMLEMSHPFMVAVKSGETQITKKLSGVDREARVLRYREKRKKRKFEKKIRYASRKAYAEMRPRIKGRFAKRKESITTELDVDRWLLTAECNTNNYGAEGEYGVVPSF